MRQKYGKGTAGYTPASGGAPVFLRFLREEVIPFVENNYRASASDRGIFGHSYGGLFVAYTLFNDPELFQKYLISSSASWWDGDVVLSYEAIMREQRKQLPARVLATVGTGERPLIKEGWERLRERLDSAGYEGFEFTALAFEGESHVSVPPTAYTKALRHLYRRGK